METHDLDCPNPTVTALGVPNLDEPASFTTTGGLTRVAVSDLAEGSLAWSDEAVVWLGA